MRQFSQTGHARPDFPGIHVKLHKNDVTGSEMKRVASHLMGVDQGELILFSDYENDGEMWTGTGDRERIISVSFSAKYRKPPAVHCCMSLLDMATGPSIRADVATRNVTEAGFDIQFRTWEDSRIARVRVAWMAIGELPDDEDWQFY